MIIRTIVSIWWHSITIFSFVVLGLFCHEKYATGIEDYLEYKTVIPTKDEYYPNQAIKYYSYVISKKPVAVDWHEDLYCTPDQDFYLHSTYDSSSPSFYQTVRYPDEIKKVLNTDPNTLESMEILRKWSRRGGNGKRPWRLGINGMLTKGETCLAKHTITVFTPYFKLEKVHTIVSNPWVVK